MTEFSTAWFNGPNHNIAVAWRIVSDVGYGMAAAAVMLVAVFYL